MSELFVSADYHLGHANIIKYCDRPFENIDKMNEVIIRNHNERVKPEDTVIHNGDFCFKGGAEGGKTASQIWESKLNGQIIHIRGNHDNNSTKAWIKTLFIEYAGYSIMMLHVPPTMCLEVPEFIDIILCGHVHEKWKIKILDDTRNTKEPIPIINVGIDVWGFYPVKMNEIVGFYEREILHRDKRKDRLETSEIKLLDRFYNE